MGNEIAINKIEIEQMADIVSVANIDTYLVDTHDAMEIILNKLRADESFKGGSVDTFLDVLELTLMHQSDLAAGLKGVGRDILSISTDLESLMNEVSYSDIKDGVTLWN